MPSGYSLQGALPWGTDTTRRKVNRKQLPGRGDSGGLKSPTVQISFALTTSNPNQGNDLTLCQALF